MKYSFLGIMYTAIGAVFMMPKYTLFLDDIRCPSDSSNIVARSSLEAMEIIQKYGLPSCMYLDHDLGGEDTTMKFLKMLYEAYPDGPIPEYEIHSNNFVGRKNIESFLNSWEKSLAL